MSRRLFLNCLAVLALILIYSGWARYLAQTYITTGGR